MGAHFTEEELEEFYNTSTPQSRAALRIMLGIVTLTLSTIYIYHFFQM